MLADMKTLMEAAYYGTSFDEVRSHRGEVAAALDATGEVRASDSAEQRA